MTVGSWQFVLATGVGLYPTVIKINHTGYLSTHPAFTVTTGISNSVRAVTVFVSGTEINNFQGDLYTNLYSFTSGNKITHLAQYFTLVDTIQPSALP